MGLLLTRDNPVPSEALDPHQAKMLAYNRVPHFLRLDIREVDLELSFIYDISGKRMLKQALRSMRMTSNQYFEWMLQLVRILENCRAYMLHPDHVLLHEECVFVDEQAADGGLHVAYLPLLEPLQPRAGMDGLRRLGILLSTHVAQWTGDGFQRLVQCLSQEDHSLADVRKLLNSLIAGTSGMGEERPVSQRLPEGMVSLSLPDASLDCSKKPEGDNEQSGPLHGLAASGSFLAAAGVPVPGGAETIRGEDENTVPETRGTPSGKSYYAAGGAAIVTAALAWRYIYMDNPGLNTLLISVGISIGAVALGAAWISGMLPRIPGMLARRESDAPSSAEGTKAPSPRQAHSGDELLRPEWMKLELQAGGEPAAADAVHPAGADAVRLAGGHAVRRAAPDAVRPSVERDSHSREYSGFLQGLGNEFSTPVGSRMDSFYADLPMHTTVLDSSSSEATVVLGQRPHTDLREGGWCTPYLQRFCGFGGLGGSAGAGGIGIPKEAAAAVERIPLAFPFVIGRSEQGVQWREAGAGVSKHHCELVQADDGAVAIRDLGSRNGTELEGEPIIPYQLYPLQSGDRFSVAGTVFQFHC
ncbi:FHA domain-containing protein [Paenibacillus dendritiformis C454]|uniref:FHA domain-containing protein n=2 Tax=Paenibacillus dendritiformis TaxID=130049 RepID=H3SHX8_9BACL|nr:FHA domain-containing protein [Paenibacillus dendritiformis C454]